MAGCPTMAGMAKTTTGSAARKATGPKSGERRQRASTRAGCAGPRAPSMGGSSPWAAARSTCPANPSAVPSKASGSNGPTTARVRGSSTRRRATRRTSSRSTASMRPRTSSTVRTSPCSSSRADPAHAGARVLAGEQRLGPQVALGHGQLPLVHALAGQQLQLTGHDRQHLVDVLGGSADSTHSDPASCRRGAPIRSSRRGPRCSRTFWNSRLDIPPPSTWLSTENAHRSSLKRDTHRDAERQVGLFGRPVSTTRGSTGSPGAAALGAWPPAAR